MGEARLAHGQPRRTHELPPRPRSAAQAPRQGTARHPRRSRRLRHDAIYATLHDLHAKGRNGLWARILKNAFAPVFLAPFDFVDGNPPWINWQNLREGYRQETKDLWVQHELFMHKGMDTILGKGRKDISTLVTCVAADCYLKDGGKLSFVITQSVFKTSGAGQGFRRFKTRRGAPCGVIWLDDFSEMQLLEGASNRTAVFVMRKGQPMEYPVQYAYWRKKETGRKGGFDYDTSLDEATAKTERLSFETEPVKADDPTSAWVTGRPLALRALKKLLGKSDYEAHAGVYSGGADAVYWCEILRDHKDGTVTARNVTEGAKRKVEPVQVQLEKELLYPMLRGRDVGRWSAEPSCHTLFVQDVAARRGISLARMRSELPRDLKWFELNRNILVQRAAFKRYFNPEKDPFYSMFNVGEYSIATWKVGWPEVANEVSAAVIKPIHGKTSLSDHTIIEVALSSEEEAHFVAGVLNSTLFRFGVAAYIVLHPGPHILDSFRVPKFDPNSELHRAIVAEAKRLSSGAADSADSVHSALDALCRGLWGVTDRELKAVEAAYRELRVTTPKTPSQGALELKEDGLECDAEPE